MLKKIFCFVMYVFMFYIFNDVCRLNSAYLPKIRIKKYIIIKNEMIAKILIAREVGRDKFVNPWDTDKMSIVGLISYIFVLPVNLVTLVLNLMIVFDYRGIDNLRNLTNWAYCILGVVFPLSWIMLTVNIWRCGKE